MREPIKAEEIKDATADTRNQIRWSRFVFTQSL